nr:restriction endonuclease subunit S [uncultured Flavobacterium sp.]
MREGWKEVTIGDLGQVITGNTPPKKDADNYGGSYPFIKPTDMDIDRRYVTNWEENYSEKAFKRYKNSYIPPRATGVVTIGTVGEKMFQADQYCFTNQSVNVVIPNENYDEDFVFYLLKYNLPKVESANPGTASGRHHVSKSNFCAITLNVPPLPTQRKIAFILSSYDDLIENNLKRIKLLEEKAQRTYEEWFVKMRIPGYETAVFDQVTGLPEGWGKKTIGEICKVSGGGTPSRTLEEYWNNGDITWYSPTDLSKANSLCVLDSSQKITELGLKKSSAKLLNENSFMMTSRATIGLFALVNHPFTTNQGFINVTPINEFEKEYLLYNFKYRVEEFKGHATGATFPELSKSKFNALDIIWPSETSLKQFNKITSILHIQLFNLTNQNRLLKEARDILLPRLMSGMIDVENIVIQNKEPKELQNT